MDATADNVQNPIRATVTCYICGAANLPSAPKCSVCGFKEHALFADMQPSRCFSKIAPPSPTPVLA